jgi:hypothetical protein
MRDRAHDDHRSAHAESPFLRRVSPRRNPWPEVVAYDERARSLSERVAALNDEIAAREEALRKAVEADREALTAWQLADGKRPRPEPTAPAIEREIEEKKADRDAANAAVERVYEDKARFVEKHRRRLVREADKAVQAAHDRYTRAIKEAEGARDELIDCRVAALWASLYPGELANEAPGDTAAVALNLRRPIEAALQVKTRLAAVGVFQVLRTDADSLAEAMTRNQALALGIADPQDDAAIWTNTPEGQERLRRERQEARERFQREWGRVPGW